MLTDDIVTPRLMLRSTREAWGPLCVDIWLDEEMGKYLADPPRDKAGDAYANFRKGDRKPGGLVPLHRIFPGERGICRHVQCGAHGGGRMLGLGLRRSQEVLAAGDTAPRCSPR